jgi:hypothetical protein
MRFQAKILYQGCREIILQNSVVSALGLLFANRDGSIYNDYGGKENIMS